jgi:hypothetical protein
VLISGYSAHHAIAQLHVEQREVAGVAFQASQFRQRDLLERLVDGVVDALPVAADGAMRLQVAAAVVRGAFGERQRAFECLQDVRGTDLPRGAREAVAAMQATRGFHQPGALQLLQQLAGRGRGDMAAARHVRRGVQLRGVARQRRQDDGGVIGEFADAQHWGCPGWSGNRTILVPYIPSVMGAAVTCASAYARPHPQGRFHEQFRAAGREDP